MRIAAFRNSGPLPFLVEYRLSMRLTKNIFATPRSVTMIPSPALRQGTADKGGGQRKSAAANAELGAPNARRKTPAVFVSPPIICVHPWPAILSGGLSGVLSAVALAKVEALAKSDLSDIASAKSEAFPPSLRALFRHRVQSAFRNPQSAIGRPPRYSAPPPPHIVVGCLAPDFPEGEIARKSIL